MVGVAIVDNQSSSSWVDKMVRDSLKIDPEFVNLERFRLSTLECVDAEHQGRAIKGLRIAPYLSEPNTTPIVRDLPTCMEREIPPAQVEHEVATYEDVKEMKPHLRRYRCSFPCRKPWKPLVLLGRDCPWAMQRIVKNDPDKDQGLMSQTPLGWTLIGPKPRLSQGMERHGVFRQDKTVHHTISLPEIRELQYFAKIEVVKSGSPAESAGFRPGDRMLSFGPVTHTLRNPLGHFNSVLEKAMGSQDPKIPVDVLRRGRRVTLTLKPRTWSGFGYIGIDCFDWSRGLAQSSRANPAIKEKNEAEQSQYTKWEPTGYNDKWPQGQSPVVPQPESKKKGATLDEVKTARVIFSFEAGGDAGGSLTLKAGEEVAILEDRQNGWWLGMNGRGEGWFPADHVTMNSDKPKGQVCKWVDRKVLGSDHPVEQKEENKA